MRQLDLRIADKYRLQRRVGGGGYGAVYIGITCATVGSFPLLIPIQGTSLQTGEEVAIKLEHVTIDPSLLESEFEAYQSLAGGPGIPRVYALEWECEYRAMIFDLLGPSLEDLFNFCGRKFSLKTVLMLVDQLIDRLDYIHSRNMIHRDIKPDNFLMGVRKLGNQVYLTDLGLVTEPRDGPSEAANDPTWKPILIGTARFASINGHLGVGMCISLSVSLRLLTNAVQSFRDDLESLGYMLVYFISGTLPWAGLKVANKEEKSEMILKHKKTIRTHDLCEGLPEEFVAYFDYIRSLPFNEKPDYSFLRKSFHDLFTREGFEYDNVYDWTILKYLIAKENNDPILSSLGGRST
ncbi:MAG: hypothetical protein Q9224_004275 [Gallowayella concinna]